MIPYRCDLSNEEDILSMFSAVRSQHSGVDICINNAGLARPDTLLSGYLETSVLLVIFVPLTLR